MKKYIILLAYSLIVVSSVQAGGPWPQKKGKAYIKISEMGLVFNQYLTEMGDLAPNTSTGIFNTALYVEYGFTNRLTGIVHAPFLSHNYIEETLLTPRESITAFGDMDLGIKYGLTKPGSGFPVSATLFLGIPTGKSSAGDSGNLQTGDGEFNQMLQIDAGTGFKLGKNKKVSSYVAVHVGFNNRTNGYSEEFRYGLEYGLGFFSDRLWINARLSGIQSLENGDAPESTQSISLYSNNISVVGYSVDIAYYITKKFGVSVGMAPALGGKNIAAAPLYSVGVFLDLSK